MNQRRTNRRYSQEFKEEAVALVIEEAKGETVLSVDEPS